MSIRGGSYDAPSTDVTQDNLGQDLFSPSDLSFELPRSYEGSELLLPFQPQPNSTQIFDPEYEQVSQMNGNLPNAAISLGLNPGNQMASSTLTMTNFQDDFAQYPRVRERSYGGGGKGRGKDEWDEPSGPVPEILCYFWPKNTHGTRAVLPTAIQPRQCSPRFIAELLQSGYSLIEIVRRINPIPGPQRMRKGPGVDDSEGRSPEACFKNRLSMRNQRWRVPNGLSGIRQHRAGGQWAETIDRLKELSTAQLLYGVIGEVTRGSYTMKPPTDRYNGVPGDWSIQYPLYKPQELPQEIRDALESGPNPRFVPKLDVFLRRNPDVYHHFFPEEYENYLNISSVRNGSRSAPLYGSTSRQIPTLSNGQELQYSTDFIPQSASRPMKRNADEDLRYDDPVKKLREGTIISELDPTNNLAKDTFINGRDNLFGDLAAESFLGVEDFSMDEWFHPSAFYGTMDMGTRPYYQGTADNKHEKKT